MSEKAVQTLDRALDILEILAVQKNGLGVTEIGNLSGLHKSTAHRLIKALCERGYVEKASESGTYKLGMKIIEISSIHLNSIELKTEATPFLRQLASETGQPVHLATFIDGEVIYIEKIDTLNTIRMYSQIGKRVPIYCSAVGKALLSGMSENEALICIGDIIFSKLTPNTIIDKSVLIKEIESTRQKGWAVDNEEHEEGIRCIAAPIYDYRGKVIAAVSASGLKHIISPELDKEISQYVIKAAGEISKRMGYNLAIRI